MNDKEIIEKIIKDWPCFQRFKFSFTKALTDALELKAKEMKVCGCLLATPTKTKEVKKENEIIEEED